MKCIYINEGIYTPNFTTYLYTFNIRFINLLTWFSFLSSKITFKTYSIKSLNFSLLNCKKKEPYRLTFVTFVRRGWTALFYYTSLSTTLEQKVLRCVLVALLTFFGVRKTSFVVRRRMWHSVHLMTFRGLVFSFSLTETLYVRVTPWTVRSGGPCCSLARNERVWGRSYLPSDGKA